MFKQHRERETLSSAEHAKPLIDRPNNVQQNTKPSVCLSMPGNLKIHLRDIQAAFLLTGFMMLLALEEL